MRARTFYTSMDRLTLADMVRDNCALRALLRLPNEETMQVCG
ncbi:MAG: hypothetical protein R3D53_13365 [Paracoccaceae bacterium]